jgi:hypothetical protein
MRSFGKKGFSIRAHTGGADLPRAVCTVDAALCDFFPLQEMCQSNFLIIQYIMGQLHGFYEEVATICKKVDAFLHHPPQGRKNA